MAAKQVLRLVFGNQVGRDVTITLNDPRPNLTAEEITAVMDTIITKNVFTSNGGDLVIKRDVKLVSTDTTDLYDSPLV